MPVADMTETWNSVLDYGQKPFLGAITMKRLLSHLLSITACLVATGCVVEPTNRSSNVPGSSSPSAAATPSPANDRAANAQPLTLPVLDAFFAEESFSELLKTRLQLTDQQVTKLKEMARSETAKLNEANAGKAEGETAAARAVADEKIRAVIGEAKARQLATLIGERWSGTSDNGVDQTATESTNPNTAEEFADSPPNDVPTDSRIVVNAPAYRMDVFDSGRLVKSYKIGIGYPQFPLPTGLRKARAIIFNPTWTPPDEPWVARIKDVKVGDKVEAGSKLNPLGPIKIPIGGPSLIHGGKAPAKLGTFSSHGCVGLTTPQVQDFAKILAQLGGGHLTDAEIAGFARDKTETKQLKLSRPIPVELRYETIVVDDGKLHIYRDVYDQHINTEENLEAVLAAFNVRLEDLTEDERAQVLDALAQMSGKSGSEISSTAGLAKPSPSPAVSPKSTSEKKTAAMRKTLRVNKNLKEIVIEIAALKGKGYPAPVDLDTGSGKTRAVVATARPKTRP
jgi:lipoprotein-anchoring transpeptidase ErfK/SrfK